MPPCSAGQTSANSDGSVAAFVITHAYCPLNACRMHSQLNRFSIETGMVSSEAFQKGGLKRIGSECNKSHQAAQIRQAPISREGQPSQPIMPACWSQAESCPQSPAWLRIRPHPLDILRVRYPRLSERTANKPSTWPRKCKGLWQWR